MWGRTLAVARTQNNKEQTNNVGAYHRGRPNTIVWNVNTPRVRQNANLEEMRGT